MDNLHWYPRLGTVDRATYTLELETLELEHLAKWDLFAGGRLLSSEPTANGVRERRAFERPVLGVSFAFGRFRARELEVGPVRVTLAVDDDPARMAGLEDKLEEALVSSLGYFLEAFGRKAFGSEPDDHLTVVTVPSDVSQSLPGFIMLSNLAVSDHPLLETVADWMDSRALVAHEVAHQWWGHGVGWRTYRDQWLSEALANYSAMLWARRSGDPSLRGLVGPTFGWYEELSRKTADGRSLESFGPLVLGERLASSRGDAYHAVVYKKGAVVLDMLATAWGEAAFADLLGRLSRAAAGSYLSTDSFFEWLEVLETDRDGPRRGLSGRNLESFKRRFVDGTGLVEVVYDYDFEEVRTEDGIRFQVRLRTEQRMPYRLRYGVVVTAKDELDARRLAVPELEKPVKLTVPLEVELETAGPDSNVVWRGRVHLYGRSKETVIDLGRLDGARPRRLRLDPEGRVYGHFVPLQGRPKTWAYGRAYRESLLGDAATARRLFVETLDLPAGQDEDGRRLDWRCALQLARLAMDIEDVNGATKWIEKARRLRPGDAADERTQARHEARLDLLTGDVKRAFATLKRLVRPKNEPGPETRLLWALANSRSGRLEEGLKEIEALKASGVPVEIVYPSSAAAGS